MSEISKKIRLAALWVLIISLSLGDLLLYVKGQIIWGTFWSIILLLVVGYEIYAYFFSKHKTTISNIWKEWTIENPFFAYLTLGLIWLGLNALIVHLAFF